MFPRTNLDCANLQRFLEGLGGGGGRQHDYGCAVLAGGRNMDERRRALQAFRDGEARLLIATDVGARGLDISGLPYVINMTLPDRAEDYIHRRGAGGGPRAVGVWLAPKRRWLGTPPSAVRGAPALRRGPQAPFSPFSPLSPFSPFSPRRLERPRTWPPRAGSGAWGARTGWGWR